MSLFDLSNRNIIVTGSNRGNGFAIANGLVDAGANVFGIDLEIDNKHNFKQFKVEIFKAEKINTHESFENSQRLSRGFLSEIFEDSQKSLRISSRVFEK